jgi:hypothetical protein
MLLAKFGLGRDRKYVLCQNPLAMSLKEHGMGNCFVISLKAPLGHAICGIVWVQEESYVFQRLRYVFLKKIITTGML